MPKHFVGQCNSRDLIHYKLHYRLTILLNSKQKIEIHLSSCASWPLKFIEIRNYHPISACMGVELHAKIEHFFRWGERHFLLSIFVIFLFLLRILYYRFTWKIFSDIFLQENLWESSNIAIDVNYNYFFFLLAAEFSMLKIEPDKEISDFNFILRAKINR